MNITTDWRNNALGVKDRLKYIFEEVDEITQQDVVIIAGCESAKSNLAAHSLILFIGSKILAELLDEAKITNDGIKEIKLPDINPNALKVVLKYLYTDCIDLHKGNTSDVLYAALKFNLQHLAAQCIFKLKEELTTDNVLAIHEQATKMAVEELVQVSQDFILINASDIFQSYEFLNIGYESICNLLAHDDLQIEEVSLFQAVIRWGAAECRRCELEDNADNLRFVLKKMIPLIRFSLMRIEDFSTIVEPTNILDETEVLDLYKYFSLRNTKTKLQPPKWILSTKLRKNTLVKISSEDEASSDKVTTPICEKLPDKERSVHTLPTVICNVNTPKDELLQYFKSISGLKTISGMYVTYTGDNRNKAFEAVKKNTGVFPGIINTRMPGLFASEIQWQSFIDETIYNWNSGYLVHIAWWDNALTSMDVNNYPEDSDETKWNELIKDGGRTNTIWKAQLDNVAKYLCQLKIAGVVAICDLLPNINEKWLYWRGRPGIDGSAKLFQITRDYIEKYHWLDCLIWVWSLHAKGDMKHLEKYWPGSDYVDVVSVYMHNEQFLPGNVNKKLLELIGDKPLSMEYVYSVPTLDLELKFLQWTWFTLYDDCLVRKKIPFVALKEEITLKNTLTSPYVVNKGNIDFFQNR